MSKRYNIRWTQDDSKELARVVKNFNAKITRLEKKNPQNKNALPEKVTVRQMKELVQTRADLKRELNSLKRFSQKGAETLVNIPGENYYNLKVTKWQRTEMNRRAAIINRKREKRLAELLDVDLQSRGEKLGYKKGQLGMGKQEEIELQPIKPFTPRMAYHDLHKKAKTLRKESQSKYWDGRDMRLVDNYIDSLERNFNPSEIKDIIEAIKNMDFDEFRKIFEAEGGTFELNYPPDDEAKEAHLTALRSIWLPNLRSVDRTITEERELARQGKLQAKYKKGK